MSPFLPVNREAEPAPSTRPVGRPSPASRRSSHKRIRANFANDTRTLVHRARWPPPKSAPVRPPSSHPTAIEFQRYIFSCFTSAASRGFTSCVPVSAPSAASRGFTSCVPVSALSPFFFVIGGFVKDRLAAVTAVKSVIDYASHRGASSAWHRSNLPRDPSAANKALCPLFFMRASSSGFSGRRAA
jgi:hypothetical protein